MIVALRRIGQLLDPFANLVRLAKIERRAGDIGQLARRNQAGVDRQIFVGVDRELVIQYGSATGAG